jgi:hypothetical protein
VIVVDCVSAGDFLCHILLPISYLGKLRYQVKVNIREIVCEEVKWDPLDSSES